MTVTEDSEIIALYFSRDQRAITETDTKYGTLCRTISLRIVGDSRDAEECVSDTYMKAWNTIPPQKPDSLGAFLGRIVRNISLDCFRRKSAQKRKGDCIPFEELSECLPERDRSGEFAMNEAVNESLNEFMASLPQEQRIYFMRRYYMGEPLNVIAERYGISANKLGVMMHRLRKKFKQKLIKDGVCTEGGGIV